MPRELLLSRLEDSTVFSDVVVVVVVASRERLPSSTSSSSPSFLGDHPVFPMRQTNIPLRSK